MLTRALSDEPAQRIETVLIDDCDGLVGSDTATMKYSDCGL